MDTQALCMWPYSSSSRDQLFRPRSQPKLAPSQPGGFQQKGSLGILTLEVELCQPPGPAGSVPVGRGVGATMGKGESPGLFQVST